MTLSPARSSVVPPRPARPPWPRAFHGVGVAPAALCVAILLAASAPAAGAARETAVRVAQSWSGRMPLGVQPPLQSSLATGAELARIWAQCQVSAPLPAVDFTKSIVLVAVRRGTTVRFQSVRLVGGNLTTNVAVTPDMPAHMTCALAAVDRAGIATVNGAPIGH
jgi:hypothetical protein